MIITNEKENIKKWTTEDIPNLQGKLALVTGSNSGLGYYTARALSQKGCHVIIASRTLEKANKTKLELEKLIPDAQLSSLELNLSDFKIVSEKADQILDDFNCLDLLVNNAGIMHPPKTYNAQGYEIQFAVNHLAHMLLTLKLLPLLEKKEKSRIVTVTSGAQFFGKGNWENLRCERYYNKWESYAESKLANVMFALDLHERLKDKNIFSLAAHPGIAKTNLFNAQKPKPSRFEKFSLEFFSPFFQSAEMGALPQLFAATSQVAKSGEHYGPKYNFRGYPKLSRTSPLATNKKQRNILWEKSMGIIREFI
tara:strand:+ start:28620 stop:29549 length:930 start_codon:yes stop_codon:yes gene_type:complete